MTDTPKPTIERGDEYVAAFRSGPFDGQTEHRVSTDGSWDDELTMLASQNGMDTMLRYTARAVRQVGETVHVLYQWDEDASEPLMDPEDRWDFDI